ncbi:cysteine synthase A [Candidatus Saganbacteria bacterium]|uniref:cysteine synthase n=1 Tax=Candidatus Saganbacteria bacterium TaxID=2575572 RepID=A0A9D6UMI6_UNCSA|nr:cysteine synthase A [Candidatus Saganbacteria bacterium]
MVKIRINGKDENLAEGVSLSQLLQAKKIRKEVVTIEINGEIIEREKYDGTLLKEGDALEFVYYMGGGMSQVPSSKSQVQNFKINVSELIGNTPLIKLNRIVEPGMAEIYAKLEMFNPGGSVKDRICLSMLEDAEKKGRLKPGGTIVEPTAGNTGIGLALLAAARGYKAILVMPETMSLERIYILRSFGAEVVLTPGVEGIKGSIKKAEEIVAKNPGFFMPHQFENPANPESHRLTTGPEIWHATGGKVDAFVMAVGTGGTLTGVGEFLKGENPAIKIVAVEPAGSPVLSGGKPGPHKIQGIGAGFIPKTLNPKIIDQIIKVGDNEAFHAARLVAQKEGIFVGISSGANIFAALQVARELGEDKTVVTVFADTGERYFSMEQFFEG